MAIDLSEGQHRLLTVYLRAVLDSFKTGEIDRTEAVEEIAGIVTQFALDDENAFIAMQRFVDGKDNK